MCPLASLPPLAYVEPVTEILHGTSVPDPYRWLEDSSSARTLSWLRDQKVYASTYFDSVRGRAEIQQRVRQMLCVETADAPIQMGSRFYFRKRLAQQEQPCICMREGPDGKDHVLIDPFDRSSSIHTSVRPHAVSADGQLLMYSVKEGGQRTSRYEILEIETRRILSDALPSGYLRGFAFCENSRGFFYVHEPVEGSQNQRRCAFLHILGTAISSDAEVFSSGDGSCVRLNMVAGPNQLGFLVFHLQDNLRTDFYLKRLDAAGTPAHILDQVDFKFSPVLLADRIIAFTDFGAPNYRIIQLHTGSTGRAEFANIVPEREAPIQSWAVAGNAIYVAYFYELRTDIHIFSFSGHHIGTLNGDQSESTRLVSGSATSTGVFIENESFVQPPKVIRHSLDTGHVELWADRSVPFPSSRYGHERKGFNSKDGTTIPITILGRRDYLELGNRPTIMTSYGGFGVAMTPRFSVLVALLIERGCLFALPHIRGGSDFGVAWHRAAQRRKRQTAIDDFLCAGEWLVNTGRTPAGRLGIFGGSNSGLLVAAAMTQRPDLFRAALCIAPLTDMLRFHLFDQARAWKEEFGTAEDAADFKTLRRYSPYHNVISGTAFPAVLIVSGDADQNCNPLHARKLTAKLQAANSSENPIILDYSPHRGHSPVLPLTERVEALTNRVAFFCRELGLSTQGDGH